MIRVARIEVAALAFLFLVIGIVIGCMWQQLDDSSPNAPRFPETPCATEDSTNCYWDTTRGQSFWDVQIWDEGR